MQSRLGKIHCVPFVLRQIAITPYSKPFLYACCEYGIKGRGVLTGELLQKDETQIPKRVVLFAFGQPALYVARPHFEQSIIGAA